MLGSNPTHLKARSIQRSRWRDVVPSGIRRRPAARSCTSSSSFMVEVFIIELVPTQRGIMASWARSQMYVLAW